jgi:glutaredoxin-related protein
MLVIAFLLVVLLYGPDTTVRAFVPPIVATTTTDKAVFQGGAVGARRVLLYATNSDNNNNGPWDAVVETAERVVRIAQRSQQEGAGVKQIMANVLAGDDYNTVAVNTAIDEAITAAPIVLFTWAPSPSCKQAIRALDIMGVPTSSYKIVRLDDPWDEGNKIRAELGKRQGGKCSVPAIYINGEYIGGYDGGIGPDRPGLVDMAFTGKLQEKLLEAGVLVGAAGSGASTTTMTSGKKIPATTTSTAELPQEMTILE